MGTKFAPTYANLVLASLEESLYSSLERDQGQAFSNYIKNNFFRYLDDCFIAFDCKYDLNYLNTMMNKMHPALKFTMTVEEKEIPFLDI